MPVYDTISKMKELKVLTGIRFFAAIHVVFFHNFYMANITDETPKALLSFFNSGEAAVDFFYPVRFYSDLCLF